MNRRRPSGRVDLFRRRLLAGMAGAAGASLLGCGSDGQRSGAAPGPGELPTLPDPNDSGIDHIVQVMMENRSFDHFLGWVPGADGHQAGLVYPDVQGNPIETFHLSADPAYGYQGCGWADPNHGYEGGRVHLNGGAMNGWLLTQDTASNPNDRFPVGYYTADDLLFYKGAAEHFTVCDRYFHGILAQTFPNRIYIHAGATDRLNNTLPYAQEDPSSLQTVWDRLREKGISSANYFHDLPTPGLWGDKYADMLLPFEQFLRDAQFGTLPAVSYIDPFFGASVGETPAGISRDDHPQADVRDGQALLAQIYDALRNGPNWERTLMIVTYDEWGGFFDHVAPAHAPIAPEEAALGNDGLLGFRVPCVLLGPRVRRGHVSHLPFDPNSVINLIRWRWGLDPVGTSPRNETSLNMAYALDFASPSNLEAPDFGVGAGPFGRPCYEALPVPLQNAPLSAAQKSLKEHQAEWDFLRDMCRRYKLI